MVDKVAIGPGTADLTVEDVHGADGSVDPYPAIMLVQDYLSRDDVIVREVVEPGDPRFGPTRDRPYVDLSE